MRIRCGVIAVIACGACGGDGDGVSISGDAFLFNGGTGLDGRAANATVSVVEDPSRTVVTAIDGHFELDGFAPGEEVTLALELANYHRIQTGTFTVGDAPIERVTFQIVHDAIYQQLAEMLQIVPDEARCQVVTTVTRVGKSLYDEGAHGEAGAAVTLTPDAAGEGPIYFNESVLPDRTVPETTEDGGVLFIQVPPGDYTLAATKPGATFRDVKVKCRAGWLVNASPPWGLQRL
jgi:hypothetical protein